MIEMKIASPMKLRSGEWGAKVQGRIRKGDVITIRTRAGKTWEAEVARVVWSGKGVSICATVSLDRPRQSSGRARRSSTGECECGACDDLLSFGYSPGQRIRCSECGGWAEAC